MVVSKVSEQGVICFPPVGKLGADAEVDGLVQGVGVENVGYPGTGYDDAGVAVPGGHYAQTASLQVECGDSPRSWLRLLGLVSALAYWGSAVRPGGLVDWREVPLGPVAGSSV